MFEELFRQYYDTGQRRVLYMLCNKHQDEWDVHRSCLYSNGVVLGKYRENDKLTINVLQSKLPTEDLCRVLKINNANDLKALLRSGKTDYITIEKINLYRKQADELSSLSIEEFINKNHHWLIDECKRKGDIDLEKVIKLAYLYFSYSLFESNENAPFSKHQDNIKALFESKGIELPSYKKYELVPLDQDRKIILVEPPRIYDKSIDKTLFIQNVPIPLLVQLKKMLDKDMFKQVSYRVKDNKVIDGRCNLGILHEEVEFGKVFSLTDLGRIKLSKLYSTSYEDCLWIKSDSSNITFEELCDDFEEYEGHIVTQVIHIEYSWHREKAYIRYITHIDHEYVFYTLDEYTNRIKDADQKGAAATRIKTFKIDDAMIPLDYSLVVPRKDQDGTQRPPANILFLHFVLENYFRHSDLLREYFGVLAARKINDSMPEVVLERIYNIMKENGIKDIGRVGLYGITYKEDVDDVRESPTLQLMDNMARHVATGIKVYDPFVKRPIVDNQYTDFDQFLDDIDILVIMVGHQHIKQNIERIRDKIIFDTKNVIPPDKTYKL